ncbi:hypothetical protein B0H14DRAFT_546754 [Mycena olivaceomarginata]|nr:hypothetical protein B0H14DRAFT_546754 [Mycena olivaceomarginata]
MLPRIGEGIDTMVDNGEEIVGDSGVAMSEDSSVLDIGVIGRDAGERCCWWITRATDDGAEIELLSTPRHHCSPTALHRSNNSRSPPRRSTYPQSLQLQRPREAPSYESFAQAPLRPQRLPNASTVPASSTRCRLLSTDLPHTSVNVSLICAAKRPWGGAVVCRICRSREQQGGMEDRKDVLGRTRTRPVPFKSIHGWSDSSQAWRSGVHRSTRADVLGAAYLSFVAPPTSGVNELWQAAAALERVIIPAAPIIDPFIVPTTPAFDGGVRGVPALFLQTAGTVAPAAAVAFAAFLLHLQWWECSRCG